MMAVTAAISTACGTATPPIPVGAPASAGASGSAVPGPSVQAPPSRPAPVGSGPRPTRRPAAAAGGACQLLDYAVVEQLTGVPFDVAAGSQQDATYTCVLQRTGVTTPDLSLAVTPSSATPTVFRSAVAPKGAPILNGLGKIAYQVTVPPAAQAGRGPGIEVGWLSGNDRIMVLRYTFAPDATPVMVQDLSPKVVELARTVDQAAI